MTDNQLLHIKAFICAPQDALYGDFDFSVATSLKAEIFTMCVKKGFKLKFIYLEMLVDFQVLFLLLTHQRICRQSLCFVYFPPLFLV